MQGRKRVVINLPVQEARHKREPVQGRDAIGLKRDDFALVQIDPRDQHAEGGRARIRRQLDGDADQRSHITFFNHTDLFACEFLVMQAVLIMEVRLAVEATGGIRDMQTIAAQLIQVGGDVQGCVNGWDVIISSAAAQASKFCARHGPAGRAAEPQAGDGPQRFGAVGAVEVDSGEGAGVVGLLIESSNDEKGKRGALLSHQIF